MRKQIFLSHGDKGGVGKSVVSKLLVEHELSAGIPVTVIEGDPTVQDVLTRYADVPEVTPAFLSLNAAGNADNAVGDLATYLEQHAPQAVVINLPAGASETVDGLGDLIRAVADTLGYDLRVVYSLDIGKAPALGLKKSLELGLMSHIDPDKRAVNYPAYKGAPDKFEWFTFPERKAFAARELVIPALANQASFRALDRTPGRIATLADAGGPGWMVVDRLNVKRWLAAALESLDPIFATETIEVTHG
ncbi:MAG: P-loop NTPase family protein [Acidiferrobacteraceae bacterium]